MDVAASTLDLHRPFADVGSTPLRRLFNELLPALGHETVLLSAGFNLQVHNDYDCLLQSLIIRVHIASFLRRD